MVKEFQKQVDAINFMESGNVLVSRDLNANGAKKFLVYDDYKEWYDSIKNSKTIPNEYEVLQGTTMRKFHIDCDINRKEINEDEFDLEEFIDETSGAILSMYEELMDYQPERDELIVLTANGAKKYSFHIILNNNVYFNIDQLQFMFQQMLEFIDEEYHSFFDKGIYTTNRSFRVWSCAKYKSKRVLQCEDMEFTFENFCKTLVCHHDGQPEICDLEVPDEKTKKKVNNIEPSNKLLYDAGALLETTYDQFEVTWDDVNNYFNLKRVESSGCEICYSGIDEYHERIDGYAFLDKKNRLFLGCYNSKKNCAPGQSRVLLINDYGVDYDEPEEEKEVKEDKKDKKKKKDKKDKKDKKSKKTPATKSRNWIHYVDLTKEGDKEEIYENYRNEKIFNKIFSIEIQNNDKHEIYTVMSFKSPRYYNPVYQCVEKTGTIEVCDNFKLKLNELKRKKHIVDTLMLRVSIQDQGIKIKDPLEGFEYRPFQQMIVDILSEEPDNRSIYWFYEPTGNAGKSSFAKHLKLKNDNIQSYTGKANDIKCALANYLYGGNTDPNAKMVRQLDAALFDYPRTSEQWISYQVLEEIKNGDCFSGKYNSKGLLFNPPHVIVTSNFLPKIKSMSKDRWKVYEIFDMDKEPRLLSLETIEKLLKSGVGKYDDDSEHSDQEN